MQPADSLPPAADTGKGLKLPFAVFGVLFLAGVTAFVLLLVFDRPERAWQLYLINFLFFSAIAQGGLLFSTIMRVTKAKWSGPFDRISESFAAFFPVSFLLFLGLFAGSQYIFPWLGQDLHGKEVWLNLPFLFGRDAIALLLLYGVGCVYSATVLRHHLCDIEAGSAGRRFLLRLLRCNGAASRPGTNSNAPADPTGLAVAYILIYAVVLSLISFDLVMSLDPHWISTLFGGYFFIKAFYIGLGALILAGTAFHARLGDRSPFKTAHFHDIGKLFFGFCMMWGYFLYTQILVIWYGNIPEETHYMISRFKYSHWKALFFAAVILAFALPFFGTMNEKVKKMPRILSGMAAVALTGIWLENLLLMGPPLHMAGGLPLPLFDAMISLGFLGLTAAVVAIPPALFPELLQTPDPADPSYQNVPAAAGNGGHSG